MKTPSPTTKFCPKCKATTEHENDECLTCAALEGEALLAATQAKEAHKKEVIKKANQKKARERKRARDAKDPAKVAAKEQSKRDAARQQLAQRELARRHLLAFIKRYEQNYMAGWVHKVICQELMEFSEAVERQESPRLMITVPPRHGKSMIASQYWPAWDLGKYPHHEFINTSYAQALQMDFSRKIQELVRSQDYNLLFPGMGIMKNNEAVERWMLAKDGVRTGGGVLAAGVGGPITGRGAHIFLIDDPVKNRDEAESQTIRETAKSWYSSTAYTRLAPGAGIVVIQTRWHDDDLAGWLLSEMREAEKEMRDEAIEQGTEPVWPEDADRWKVIDFPAIATHDETYRNQGEALHPDRYDLKALRKIKRTLAPRDWAALYQQNPQVEEGAYFSKKMIRYYTSNPPLFMDIYCAGDLAISKNEQADWTVFMVAGVDEHENIYMLEEYRDRGLDADQIVDLMFEIHDKWKPRRFGLEKGHISMTMDSILDRRIRDAKKYELHIEELKPGKADKELRARPIQGLMSHGKVFWPQGALWVDDHLNELLRFPNGVKDDRVDADAWIGKMLALQTYIGTGRPKVDTTKSWKKKLAGYVSGHKESNNSMAA